MNKAIILNEFQWKLVDDRTGQERSGISFYYILSDSLKPVTNSNGSLGYSVAKASVPIDLAPKFIAVPGIYDIDLQAAISGGKPYLKVASVDFVKSL